mmetsp:Transcript_11481/g.19082  ORF Transcript_11481/g.19082 Transcript_11481/m.19082 type:complete len:223 (-) Transcript_11481:295-963(-)
MGNTKSSSSASSGAATRVSSKAADPAPMGPSGMSNKLALGAGCYWGTDKFVRKDFEKKFPGSIVVKATKVGFMSPEAKPRFAKPTYQQVCTGRSGHVEVLSIELNKPEEHFEELIRFFFSFHDPTTLNQQGNDRGFQYASYIFCGDDKQQAISDRVMAELQQLVDAKLVKRFSGKKVTTRIGPLKEFTVAQAEHQEYLANNPNGYCNHFIRKCYILIEIGGV